MKRVYWIAGAVGAVVAVIGGIALASTSKSSTTPNKPPPPEPPPPGKQPPGKQPPTVTWVPIDPPVIESGITYRLSFDAAPGVNVQPIISLMVQASSITFYTPGQPVPDDWPTPDVATPPGAATWRAEFFAANHAVLKTVAPYGLRLWRKLLGA